MNAVSLFSGVGGFDLALERHGIPVVASVEIDKRARGVIARHFPNTQLFNDVTEVTGGQLRDAGFVPDDGIITGGFPCQDLSVAGRRAGLAGERSGLFWEIARLADELQPRWLILENVPGLLSSQGGRDMGIVLGTLGELGYGFAYRVLDSQFFGLAQRRKRVFIVGCLGDDGRAPGEVLALREGVRGYPAPSRATRQDIAGDVGEGVAKPLGTKRHHDLDNETYVPVLLTMREGKDGGGKGPLVSVDQSLTLATGNGQVLIRPFVKVIRSGARDENGDLPPEVWAEREVAPTLNVMDNTGDSRATVLLFGDGRRGNDQLIEGDGAAPTLQARAGTGGNNVPMIARTLTARHDSSPDGDRGFNIIPSESTVRRLTPEECETLQGFPRGWTEGQPDSARYKQMGNAVSVPVVEWIVSRIVGLGR